MVTLLATIYGGLANTRGLVPIDGRIVLQKNNALAMEYDAGTGGAATVAFAGHYTDGDS